METSTYTVNVPQNACSFNANNQKSGMSCSDVLSCVNDLFNILDPSTFTDVTVWKSLQINDKFQNLFTSVGTTGGTGLPTGASTQYFRGDKSLALFPTTLSFFTNDVGFIT